ncbi:hypothetical protein Bca4012_057523 [Brassica carinata]
MKVEELINQEDRSWRIAELEKILSTEDVQEVLSIKLSKYASHDRHIWPYNKNMEYSVKSGYWVATHICQEVDTVAAPPGSLSLKDQIWKLNIIPKIKVFLWKVVSGAIATYAQLCTRGINTDPVCQRCCLEEETINHALFRCPYAYATWRCSNLPVVYQFSDNLEDNMSMLFQFLKDCGDIWEQGILSFWIVWYVWKSRNEFLFNRRNVQPIEDANRAIRAKDEWCYSVKKKETGVQRTLRSSKWEPPPVGWLKCNFDCSFSQENEYAGLGCIVRNDQGKLVGCASMKILTSQIKNAFVGEAYAFLFVLQLVWIKGWRQLWFESDNLELVKTINTRSNHLDLGNILADLHYWMNKLQNCSIDHVNREKNQAADMIARKSLEDEVLFSFSFNPPIWLIDYLYHPYTV